jgi:hypothetical protein
MAVSEIVMLPSAFLKETQMPSMSSGIWTSVLLILGRPITNRLISFYQYVV